MAVHEQKPINLDIAHTFITALGALIATGAPKELSNPREAMLMAVPAGNELGLKDTKYARERDLIAVAFKPGYEQDGPSNIAVYERLNNRMIISPHCSLYCSPEPVFLMIASHDSDLGFGYGDARLVRYGKIPREGFEERVKLAKIRLQSAAKASKRLMPSIWPR